MAITFFAWRMGRKVSRPVGELMVAVEKIRQQDLNFSISYHERNELGDLCSAFNELRCELQGSLEREWRKQEEMRTMVAALSHDLRTPLTIIQGHTESLVRAEAGEKARRATGLGLSTCKLLVEKHGGIIAIQNHPASGCEVTFSLPFHVVHRSFAGELGASEKRAVPQCE